MYTIICTLYSPGTRLTHDGLTWNDALVLQSMYLSMPQVARATIIGQSEFRHGFDGRTVMMTEVSP